ncbi:MAG: hypothetical protein H7Y88_06035, partial [Phycisphaerales bacterium]|nr:hypothetical protein [Phycisphaerales bacterium]
GGGGGGGGGGDGGGGGGGGGGDEEPPPVPPFSLAADPGASLFGSASGSGRLTITTRNTEDRPILFQQSDSGWLAQDFLLMAGGPDIDGEPLTWTDPKDGRAYAAARSASGFVLYTNDSGTAWSIRNLSAELGMTAQFRDDPSTFITTDGKVWVAGLTTDGQLICFTQTGAGASGDYDWEFVNISTRDLAPQGLSTPAFVGSVISYVTAWNGLNVAGLDANGNINSVWWAPGQNAWSTVNLSEVTGAAPITGGLTAYLTSWGGINLAGMNSSGDVTVTWWVPGFAGDWRQNNLTSEITGPAMEPASVASYVTSWGGLNIIGLDSAGNLTTYWWAPAISDTGWQITRLSEQITAPPIPTGAITGITSGNTISVIGSTIDGDVVRYHWTVGGEWLAESLSDIAVRV